MKPYYGFWLCPFCVYLPMTRSCYFINEGSLVREPNTYKEGAMEKEMLRLYQQCIQTLPIKELVNGGRYNSAFTKVEIAINSDIQKFIAELTSQEATTQEDVNAKRYLLNAATNELLTAAFGFLKLPPKEEKETKEAYSERLKSEYENILNDRLEATKEAVKAEVGAWVPPSKRKKNPLKGKKATETKTKKTA